MNIINLTNDYIKSILEDNALRAYEKTYPALFQHYFQYWGEKKKFFPALTRTEVQKRKKLVTAGLKTIEKKMGSAGFDLSNIDCVLFVSQGTSNGHAFKDGKKFVVWIPIEGYETKLQTLVFITHEIVHGLHYSYSPDFYFKNVSEKLSVARQVITEGLATYLSMKILSVNEGVALWADYISKDKIKIWLQKCRQKEQELYNFVLKNFSSRSPKIELFCANDSKDIYRNRAGYFVGLQAIDQICKDRKINAMDLLKIHRKKFEKIVIEQLQSKVE